RPDHEGQGHVRAARTDRRDRQAASGARPAPTGRDPFGRGRRDDTEGRERRSAVTMSDTSRWHELVSKPLSTMLAAPCIEVERVPIVLDNASDASPPPDQPPH